MTAIDWIIVLFAAGLAVVGYQQGLLVGMLSLGGFAGGAFLGSRLGPELLSGGSESPYAPVTALLGGILLGGVVAVALEGFARAARARWVWGRLGTSADGVGGAVLLAALAFGLAWVCGAVALHTPGARELRSDIQRSVILRELNEVLPPSGPVLQVLNRIDPTPQVRGPEARVPAPESGIARDPDVGEAGRSVVRVLGTACGLGVSGSGWVAEPGLVVTNAHVVAGQDDTTITTRDGAELDATPVHYEPKNDLAVLRVDESHQTVPGRVADRAARHRRGGARIPGERTVHGLAGTVGSDGRGGQRGCLRPRSGEPPNDLVSRQGAERQLGRTGGRRRGAGAHDGFRGPGRRRAGRRPRRAERRRPGRPRAQPSRRRHRPVRDLRATKPLR